uniref:Uncharacterized protein n=2 Tax=Dunaliella tertiolecta TaxID=3047 RepID=A0A7S3VM80_DUNTE
MPQGGWWLEQSALFDPSSSLGVMRHLDIASGPPHKRPPNPTGGALNPSGRTNSRSGSRHSWSRGSAHGPSPPLAPSTPAGPSGARSLGSGLEVFAPFAHGTDALTGVAHGLHSSPMQQQLQLFGGPQAKNAPSWRPGVPTAEIYPAPTPTNHASAHAPIMAGSLTGLRTLLGSRQGQQQTQVHGATAPGMAAASHASSPHARPLSSPSPTAASSGKGTSAAVSSSMPGTGNVFVATPGAMHALGHGPHQHQLHHHQPDHHHHHLPDHQHHQAGHHHQQPHQPGLHQQQHPQQPDHPQQHPQESGHPQQQHQEEQQQAQQHGVDTGAGQVPSNSSTGQQLEQQEQHRQHSHQQPHQQQQTDACQGDEDSIRSPNTTSSTTTSLQKPLSSPVGSEPNTSPDTHQQHAGSVNQVAAAAPPAPTAGESSLASATVTAAVPPHAAAGAAAAAQPQDSDPGANFGPWSLEATPPVVPTLSPRSASSVQVPQPINQTTPRRSSSNNAVGATSARAPPPPSTPRQRQQQQQQQRSPRTQHELQSAGTDPDGTLSKPGPFDANNSGEPEDANGPSSTEIPPPPTPPSPSNHARHATHPTPAGQSNSHTASHTTLSGQPVTHPSPAAPAAMHPALSRPHTSGPAFQGAGSSSAQHWEGGLNESPTYTGGPSATAPVARPHTSHSPSAFTLRMPGAGGPTGSVHPHSNTAMPPRLSTMGGGFRTFVPRQTTQRTTPRGLHSSHNR